MKEREKGRRKRRMVEKKMKRANGGRRILSLRREVKEVEQGSLSERRKLVRTWEKRTSRKS